MEHFSNLIFIDPPDTIKPTSIIEKAHTKNTSMNRLEVDEFMHHSSDQSDHCHELCNRHLSSSLCFPLDVTESKYLRKAVNQLLMDHFIRW